MGASRRQVGFLWTLWWRPVLTLLFPLILSSVLFWDGIDLNKVDNKKTTAVAPSQEKTENVPSVSNTKAVKPVKEDKPKPKPKPDQWKQARAVFIVALMGCYWVSECLPLPVTALCPVFLLPLMEITDTDTVTSAYLNGSVMLLTAGCMMAQAFEYSNLHSRIALKVACLVGARIPLLLGGVMFTSMFLSMWMNNTSTTSMMIPVIAVLMDEFEAGVKEPEPDVTKPEVNNSEVKPEEVSPPTDPVPPSETPNPSEDSKTLETKAVATVSEKDKEAIKAKKIKEARNVKIMFLLGAAWASNIGGTGILIGSGTNIIAQTEFDPHRKKVEKDLEKYNNGSKCSEALEISFLGWTQFNVVPMLISTILTWIILLLWFTGIPRFLKCGKALTPQNKKIEAEERKAMRRNVEKAILAKYHQLGSITLHEILVLVVFCVLVVLWITEKIEKWGWGTLAEFADYDDGKGTLTTKYTHSAIPALFMCMFLFVLPKEAKYYKDIANGGLAHGLKDPLLPWREAELKLPWGPLVLIGGGAALSKAITASGLGDAIGIMLRDAEILKGLSRYEYLAVILLVVALLTAIASNTATASILSPVIIQLSFTKGIHPLYLMIPATTGASYAFVLPISTPPNAIAFDKSDMKQSEMALPGLIVTIVSNLVLYAMVHSYCELIFKFSDYKNDCGEKHV